MHGSRLQPSAWDARTLTAAAGSRHTDMAANARGRTSVLQVPVHLCRLGSRRSAPFVSSPCRGTPCCTDLPVVCSLLPAQRRRPPGPRAPSPSLSARPTLPLGPLGPWWSPSSAAAAASQARPPSAAEEPPRLVCRAVPARLAEKSRSGMRATANEAACGT